MWNKEKSELKALLWSTFVHVDLRTGRSIKHGDGFTNHFAQFVKPLPDPTTTFEERVSALR
jgi:acyl-CoA thioester hydrolase